MISKKYMIIIFIILLIIAISIYSYSQSQIKVGTVYMTAPNGYQANIDEKGIVNLTNGYDSLILNEYSNNSTDINYSINYYVQMQERKNITVILQNFTLNNISIYKTMINSNSTPIYHYWFLNNGRIYEFIAFDGNNNSDQLVKDLIKSMRTSMF